MEEVEVTMQRLNHCDDEEQRKIDELYGLLKEEGTKDCLKDMEKRTTCHTPLHEAAAVGMSQLALEVANLKPSLAWKLNHEGQSPMHLALRNRHVCTVRALMVFDSRLIQVHGRNRVTPLHYAAELEETKLLAEFLSACPSSIEDLTSRCETALHVAVRNKRPDACKVLLEWMIRKKKAEMLSWKDVDGNTVLHIATLTNQPEVVKLLIKHVNVNAKNFAGSTALDLCYGERYQLGPNVEVMKILSDVKARRASEVSDCPMTCAAYLAGPGLRLMECWEQRLGLTDAKSRTKYRVEFLNMTLVVAVLIATATYQGVLSPPGGYWQDDSTAAAAAAPATGSCAPSPAGAAAAGGPQSHTAGRMTMSGLDRTTFLVYNSGAFVSSVIVIIMITSLFEESTFMLYIPVTFVMATYFLALTQATTDNKARTISALTVGAGLMVVIFVFVWTWQKLIMRNAQLDVLGRRIGGFI